MPMPPPFSAISRKFAVRLRVTGMLLAIGIIAGGRAQHCQAQTSAGTSSKVSLPSWVPVYPGAKVELDSRYPNTNSEMQFVLSTSAPFRQVVAFFENRLTLAGFSVVKSGSGENGSLQMNSHDPSGSRAVNLFFGTRMSLTEVSMEVVQRDEARQSSAAGARIPAWVPPYPRAVPQNLSDRQSGREHSVSFTFITRDDARTILSWYQDRLRQTGFTVTMDVAGTSGALRSNTRDNSRALKIEVSAAGGQNVALFEVREQR